MNSGRRTGQDWFTVSQVAARYKVGQSTVRRWIREGRFGVGREHVLRLGGVGVRIGQAGLFFLEDEGSQVVLPGGSGERPLFARSEGELRRKLSNG
jgi:hypothetical protein